MPIDVPENINQWFKEKNFKVKLHPEESSKEFSSLSDLHDFIESEVSFWSSVDDQIHRRFASALNHLVTGTNPSIDERSQQSNISNALNILQNPVWVPNHNRCLVFSKTQLAKKVKIVYERYGKFGRDVFLNGVLFDTLKSNPFGGQNKFAYFGLIDAYVYNELNNRLEQSLKDEETSLSEIQSKFSVFFDECSRKKDSDDKQFDQFCTDFKEWTTERDKSFSEQKGAFNTAHAEQLQSQQDQFEAQDTKWRDRIQNLEDLFERKLMLEAPIKYWERLEKKHRCWGLVFSGLTIVTAVAVVSVLGTALYKWPPEWLNAAKWDLNTLKGSFLLLALTSISAYAIHFVSKFAISSFHLARDAEERKQLTYVYLSMLRKKAVPEADQKIILQALFSRADTGLLKGDHGPSMPNPVMNILGGK